MPAWLNLWNDASLIDLLGWDGRTANPLNVLRIPYGYSKISPMNVIYIANVNWTGSRFELFGRIEARQVRRVRNHRRDTLRVVAKRGSASRVRSVILPPDVVDRLVVRYVDGSDHHVKRNEAGDVIAGQFNGRSSIRELIVGADDLENLIQGATPARRRRQLPIPTAT